MNHSLVRTGREGGNEKVRRIRIMHVVRSLGTGGTEEGVRKLLAGLDRDTFEQTVCTVVAGPVVEPQTGARMVNLGRSAEASGFLVPDLIRVLVREAEMRCKFSRLRQERCECIRAERLKFIDVHEEGYALLWRPLSPFHRD